MSRICQASHDGSLFFLLKTRSEAKKGVKFSRSLLIMNIVDDKISLETVDIVSTIILFYILLQLKLQR